MENAQYKPSAPFPENPVLGEVAQTDCVSLIPTHSVEPVAEPLKTVPRPKVQGIVLPMFPYYIRNKELDLKEFLIY